MNNHREIYCSRLLWLLKNAPKDFNVFIDYAKDNARYNRDWIGFKANYDTLQTKYDLASIEPDGYMELYHYVFANRLYNSLRKQNLIEKFAFDRI